MSNADAPDGDDARQRAESREHSIVVERVIDASAADLYAAWTEPALMRRWMATRIQSDARVGGRYRLENDADAPVGAFVHVGEYLALDPGRRIFKTLLADRVEPDPTAPSPFANDMIDVRLRALSPTRTALALTNGWDGEGLDDDDRNEVKRAWAQWLDRLETLYKEKEQ